MKLSVIIPCFNEAPTIKELLNRVRQSEINAELEVIVIDDWSNDYQKKLLC